MKTYFAGIRQWSAAMAVGAPLLRWAGFLMLTLGARWWALIPWVLGTLAAVSFPPGLKLGGEEKAGEPGYLRWLAWPGLILIYYWLGRQPEFLSLLERVMSGEALRQWPVMAGALALAGAAMWRRWRAVKRLTDEEIYDFFKTPGK